ncbi:MAG: toprim domain-containing protein [Planctomycetota bacterium]
MNADSLIAWKSDRGALLEALKAAGAEVFRGGAIRCPWTDNHRNGDKHPSGSVYTTADGEARYHCHACKVNASIVDVVALITGKPPAQVIREHRLANKSSDTRRRGKFAGFVNVAKRMRDDQPRRPQPPAVDFLPLARQFHAAADVSAVAETLGVSIDSMQRLRAGRITRGQLGELNTHCHIGDGCWCFPMRCHEGGIIGLRTRFDDGEKRAITGGRQGLFYDSTLAAAELLHVVEGCSDTAAMLTLGFDNVVGLPSAGQGADLLALLIQRLAPPTPRCMLIADRDQSGIEGMTRVARQLARWGIRSRVTEPPGTGKDVRQYLLNGGDAAGILMLADGEAERTVAA